MYVKSFEPISNEDSILLILGTMPSNASLSKEQYYGNPNNLFWDIMFRVLDKDWGFEDVVKLDYEVKKELLLKNGIALWDVLKYCDRKGSLDISIKNEIKNDLPIFLKKHSKIQTICFNGKKASEYFTELIPKIPNIENIQQLILQSTSPRNTKNSFYILKEWTLIRNLINNK